MSKTYFKTISLIEGIYLDKEKILLQRDWSKYFDFEIIYNKENILETGVLRYLSKNNDSKLKSDDINKLIKNENNIFKEGLNNLLKSNINIYDVINKKSIFELINTSEISLVNREYEFSNKTYLVEFKNIIKKYLYSFLYGINRDLVLYLDIDKFNFSIKRTFNFKSFFLQNEALFDPNNDFFNTGQNSKKIRTLAGKLKETDENGKKIHLQTIENRIKTGEIKEGHIFRVDVNFDNKLLDLKDIKIEGNKEYNFLFFERNDYLVFDVNK